MYGGGISITEEDLELERYGLEGEERSESEGSDVEDALYRKIHYNLNDSDDFHTDYASNVSYSRETNGPGLALGGANADVVLGNKSDSTTRRPDARTASIKNLKQDATSSHFFFFDIMGKVDAELDIDDVAVSLDEEDGDWDKSDDQYSVGSRCKDRVQTKANLPHSRDNIDGPKDDIINISSTSEPDVIVLEQSASDLTHSNPVSRGNKQKMKSKSKTLAAATNIAEAIKIDRKSLSTSEKNKHRDRKKASKRCTPDDEVIVLSDKEPSGNQTLPSSATGSCSISSKPRDRKKTNKCRTPNDEPVVLSDEEGSGNQTLPSSKTGSPISSSISGKKRAKENLSKDTFFVDNEGMALGDVRREMTETQSGWKEERERTRAMLKRERGNLLDIGDSSGEDDCMVIESCSEDEGLQVHFQRSGDGGRPSVDNTANSVAGKWSKQPKRDPKASGGGRYFIQTKQRNIKCLNCFEVGHIKRECPKPPRVPVCILCGMKGHMVYACPRALCFKCSLPGHQMRSCKSRNQQYAYCSRCQMPGHTRNMCTDQWRQFHLTTVSETLVKPGESQISTTQKDIYCCNCSQKGHRYYDCSSARFDEFTMFTYDMVAKYDGRFKVPEKGESAHTNQRFARELKGYHVAAGNWDAPVPPAKWKSDLSREEGDPTDENILQRGRRPKKRRKGESNVDGSSSHAGTQSNQDRNPRKKSKVVSETEISTKLVPSHGTQSVQDGIHETHRVQSRLDISTKRCSPPDHTRHEVSSIPKERCRVESKFDVATKSIPLQKCYNVESKLNLSTKVCPSSNPVHSEHDTRPKKSNKAESDVSISTTVCPQSEHGASLKKRSKVESEPVISPNSSEGTTSDQSKMTKICWNAGLRTDIAPKTNPSSKGKESVRNFQSVHVEKNEKNDAKAVWGTQYIKQIIYSEGKKKCLPFLSKTQKKKARKLAKEQAEMNQRAMPPGSFSSDPTPLVQGGSACERSHRGFYHNSDWFPLADVQQGDPSSATQAVAGNGGMHGPRYDLTSWMDTSHGVLQGNAGIAQSSQEQGVASGTIAGGPPNAATGGSAVGQRFVDDDPDGSTKCFPLQSKKQRQSARLLAQKQTKVAKGAMPPGRFALNPVGRREHLAQDNLASRRSGFDVNSNRTPLGAGQQGDRNASLQSMSGHEYLLGPGCNLGASPVVPPAPPAVIPQASRDRQYSKQLKKEKQRERKMFLKRLMKARRRERKTLLKRLKKEKCLKDGKLESWASLTPKEETVWREIESNAQQMEKRRLANVLRRERGEPPKRIYLSKPQKLKARRKRKAEKNRAELLAAQQVCDQQSSIVQDAPVAADDFPRNDLREAGQVPTPEQPVYPSLSQMWKAMKKERAGKKQRKWAGLQVAQQACDQQSANVRDAPSVTGDDFPRNDIGEAGRSRTRSRRKKKKKAKREVEWVPRNNGGSGLCFW